MSHIALWITQELKSRFPRDVLPTFLSEGVHIRDFLLTPNFESQFWQTLDIEPQYAQTLNIFAYVELSLS